MSHNRSSHLHPGRPARGEVVQVLRAIQELALELAELRRDEHPEAELAAKERTLEQLRWRLATLARRLAADELGAAA